MSTPTPQLSPKIDQCDVCRAPLSNGSVKILAMNEIVSFCSEACRNVYIEDPQKYQPQEEELE